MNQQKGNALLLALILVGIISILSAGIGSYTKNNLDTLKQGNLNGTTEQVRNKIFNLITSPWAWNFVVSKNPNPFAAATSPNYADLPLSEKRIDLYAADSNGAGTLYYKTTDLTAGFDFYGKPCSARQDPGGNMTAGFDPENGNDLCPFRYEVYLMGRVFRNGNWIDTVRMDLKFKPSSPNFVLNTTKTALSFEVVRNFNEKSAETSCIAIGGHFNTYDGMCTRLLTPRAQCGGSSGFNGPVDPVCVSFRLAETCPGGRVAGFRPDGELACGALSAN